MPKQQVTEGVNTLITDPSKGRAFVIEVQGVQMAGTSWRFTTLTLQATDRLLLTQAEGRVVAQMQIIYEWSDW